VQYKLNDDDKTLAHNPADQPKDPKKAMKKVSSNLKKASKAHAKQSKQLAKASAMHAKDSKTVEKKKYNPKYTKGSSDVGRRKQLMDKIAHIYETEKQPYSAAVKKKLDRLMKERDKL